ncbi:MAG: hypothetical protein CO129_08910 [Ignavibacteriales bacterium CG_4_9_14_3_um_filter_34_10]|nr:MAG: hypothetical protein CO129_08910 [Ignavibacteriales bacterium CG_4_9_14_3_um_filter_34_10]
MKFSLLFFITCLIVNGQTADTIQISKIKSVKIDSIKIVGNDKTRDFIILRELTVKKNEKVDKKKLDFNKERVYSLGLFNFVRFYLVKENELVILTIEVEESWYIYPIPFLYFYGKGYDKATYGIDFLWKNFRGKNESLRVIAALGYDPYLLVNYYNPAFWDYNEFLFSPSFYFATPKNKSTEATYLIGKDFEYKIFNTRLAFGKRFSQFLESYITIGHSYIETDYALKKVTASGKKIDNSMTAGIYIQADSRNLKQFPESGIFATFDYQKVGLLNSKIDFTKTRFDYRHYLRVKNLFSLRWRLLSINNFGKNTPFYNYSFFGYDEYVRGHRYDYREGENLMFGSLETSIPLLKEKEISFDIPNVPKKLTSARLDIQLIFFFDHGITYKKAISFKKENYYSGFGIGITFLILPFNAVRFEYAMNEKFKGEFLLATGFSF